MLFFTKTKYDFETPRGRRDSFRGKTKFLCIFLKDSSIWTNSFLENNNIFSPYDDEGHLLYINLFLFKNESTTTLNQQIFPIDSIYHSSNMIQQFLYYYKYIHHNTNSTRDFFLFAQSFLPVSPIAWFAYHDFDVFY